MNFTNNTRRRSSSISLLVILLISALVLTVRGADSDEKKDMQDPSLVERAIGITGLNSQWDALHNWAKLAWMNLRPPDATFGQGSDTANVKEAAAKSFETSKATVRQAAASAAKVAGEVVEKTTEKLKQTLSSERETKSEI